MKKIFDAKVNVFELFIPIIMLVSMSLLIAHNANSELAEKKAEIIKLEKQVDDLRYEGNRCAAYVKSLENPTYGYNSEEVTADDLILAGQATGNAELVRIGAKMKLAESQ